MIRHHGNRRYRFKDNPLEKAFADAWEDENCSGPEGSRPGHGTLAYSLGDGKDPGVVEPRDAMVAATTIQWLGSPVGQCFLARVIATKEGAELRKRIEHEIKRIVEDKKQTRMKG
jgi:hypothetical protein